LAALPPALRRALDGMAATGELDGAVRMRLPLEDPAHLQLDGDLAPGCLVPNEPPLADAGRLIKSAPTLPGAVDADGRPRVLVLGPGQPGFRRLEQLPAHVVSTFVEAEDGRFWRHRGLDLSQIRRALAHDWEIGAPGRGGSTITQQVAKNLFLSGERTLGRKLEESVLAWRLESRLGKRRILELYLNLVELGPGVYGVAEGARHWFGKDASTLTLDEAAQLAALLPAPRRGMDEAFSRRLAQLRGRLPGLDAAQHAMVRAAGLQP
jgi:membrane carboxypeptidase/penicillin-binding protein